MKFNGVLKFAGMSKFKGLTLFRGVIQERAETMLVMVAH